MRRESLSGIGMFAMCFVLGCGGAVNDDPAPDSPARGSAGYRGGADNGSVAPSSWDATTVDGRGDQGEQPEPTAAVADPDACVATCQDALQGVPIDDNLRSSLQNQCIEACRAGGVGGSGGGGSCVAQSSVAGVEYGVRCGSSECDCLINGVVQSACSFEGLCAVSNTNGSVTAACCRF